MGAEHSFTLFDSCFLVRLYPQFRVVLACLSRFLELVYKT